MADAHGDSEMDETGSSRGSTPVGPAQSNAQFNNSQHALTPSNPVSPLSHTAQGQAQSFASQQTIPSFGIQPTNPYIPTQTLYPSNQPPLHPQQMAAFIPPAGPAGQPPAPQPISYHQLLSLVQMMQPTVSQPPYAPHSAYMPHPAYAAPPSYPQQPSYIPSNFPVPHYPIQPQASSSGAQFNAAAGASNLHSRKTSTSSTASGATAQGPSRKDSTTSTATASGNARGKRKRTERTEWNDKDQPKEAATEPSTSVAPAQLAEQIASNRVFMEMIQAQNQQITQQLALISQNTHLLPNRDQIQEPLLAQADVLKGLLDGSRETNDLLRVGFSALRERPGESKSNTNDQPDGEQDHNMGGSGGEQDQDSMPVRKRAKKGPDHRDPHDNALARVIRQLFKSKYIGHVSDPGQDGTAPSVDNLVLDLGKTPGSSWNKRMKHAFVQAVFDSDLPELVDLRPSKADVERYFISNFRAAHLKHAWSKLSNTEKQRRKQQARRKGRKRWLYYRRVGAAHRFSETQRHIPMIAAYGADGMSTDESCHDNGTGLPFYRIVNKSWRHPNATSCFRTLDAIHRDSRFLPIRQIGSGAHARNRIMSELQTSRPPVRGLPTGLYNPNWLSDKPSVFKQDLEVVSSGDYDFSHDASIIDLTSNNHGQLDAMHVFAS